MDVREHVNRQIRPSESLLLLTDCDIGPDGSFGRRWLAVTSDRILVYTENGKLDAPDLEIALNEVKDFRANRLVGQFALEAECDSRRIEVLRCTNALSERFAKVTKSLSDARKNGGIPHFEIEEEARNCPTCGRLLPERGTFCPFCLKKRKVLGRLWGYMRPHWPKLALASGAMTIATAIDLVPPYLQKILINDVILGEGGARMLLGMVVLLATLRLSAALLAVVQGRVAVKLSALIIHEVRRDYFGAVQALSLRRYDKLQTGALISRLTGDTTWLAFFFGDMGALIVPQCLLLVGIAIMLFVLHWKLALLVLLPMPLVVLMTLFFFRRLVGLYHRLWQRHSRMSAHANDAISGVRAVKTFSQERCETDRFTLRSSRFAGAAYEAEQLWATSFPLLGFVTTLGTFIVWYLGGLGVMNEEIDWGTLIAFLTYVTMFYTPVQMLTRYGDFMNRALTSAQRLFEIMDAEQEVYDDPHAAPMPESEGAFEFDGVYFGYLKDKPVLKGVDAKVNAGEMIGLVGSSGVGKTTLTNLICRFYDVDGGAIRLDGVDIRRIRLRDLRRHISIVPQDCFLFDGTIVDNIAYARPEASREDVIRAAITANAHGFIMRLPEGYDTRVGERGARLSGGEKQRVAIARAILQDPKILVLDEATSSVDTETEEMIQQALSRLVKGRTTFAIAHRLTTLRNADRIFVLDEGKVAESGTHDELLAHRGIYWRLVELQSKLSAVKAVDG